MWPSRPVTAALQALDWLRPRQSLSDGGYGSDGGSAEALLSIGANGHAAADWRRQSDAPSLASYWLGRAGPYSRAGGAQAGKLAVGMAAADICWPQPAVQPSAYYSPTSGIYAEGAGPQAWAILGTLALSRTVPAEAIGCSYPRQTCFCQCAGASCIYWSYWYLTAEGLWKYSNLGGSNRTVRDGDVDAWVWGAVTSATVGRLPAVRFSDICAPPTPTASPTATATEPPPTSTPAPTSAPTPLPPTATSPPPTETPRPPTATPLPPRRRGRRR